MDETTAVERVLRRDRLIVLAGLGGIALLAWLFVFDGAGTGMSVRAMTTWRFPPPLMPAANEPWPAAYWLVMLAMWWVMMVAMMVPSAAPVILLYARVTRHAQRQGQLPDAAVPTAWFALGYLAAWLLFSAAATGAQWGLERLGLTHMMMMWSLDRWLTAGILVVAGLYQFTPFKQMCLRHCRSPAQFLSRRWRPGKAAALRLGLEHGSFCVGCCWVLMALLFVGGIMNLVWIAALAVLILLEKVSAWGPAIGRAAGLAMLVGGGYVIVAA